MCIIVAKPIGKELPKREILRNCFNNNKHGAGIMFNHNNRVYIYKGFMTLDSLYDIIDVLEDKYDLKNKGLVIHFRISTNGKIDKGNCHPYPISNEEKKLRKIKLITKDVAMAHNGTIHLCSGRESYLNDTQFFIKEVISPIYDLNKSFYQNDKVLEMLEGLAKSKLCFLDKIGQLYLLGDFINSEGIYYSNSSYQSKGQIINSNTHIQNDVALFDELYFRIDEDNFDEIKESGYANLMKKVILLEKGEYVYNSAKDRLYEVDDFENDLGYDSEMNLYEINQKEKTASLIDINIEF